VAEKGGGGGRRREKTHDIIVCNLGTTVPSGRMFSSSQMSTHSSNCGSTSIESPWPEVLGIISQSIALGSQFAAIPDSTMFWCMIVDRPVVNKSKICVLGKRELLRLTMLLFFKLLPFLVNM
jgi:hypothetical protein